jgi:hypothetical protein
LVMISSGIRVGAWNHLKWKHVTPLYSPKNEKAVIAAKLVVLKGKGRTKNRPFYTFITPEAYQALKECMDFRTSYGEQITGESWLIRDKFPTATEKNAARKSMATNPKKLSLGGIKKAINRALWAQGLRDLLPKDEHRHEFKLSHGFRKYYKTNTERAGMLSSSIAILMDHSEGVPIDNYSRPTEDNLLQDYLKAVDNLSVNKDQKIATQLQKQVTELTEKSKEDTYIIKGKLAEKETEIEDMKKRLESIEANNNRNFQLMLDLGMLDPIINNNNATDSDNNNNNPTWNKLIKERERKLQEAKEKRIKQDVDQAPEWVLPYLKSEEGN